MSAPVLVTGAAGFLGLHVSRALLAQGHGVVGIDDLNAYYDPTIKQRRVRLLEATAGFAFERLDVSDAEAVRALFDRHRFRRVVHLAAQAGVRHSLRDPFAYARSNLVGMTAVLEACRHGGVEHLVYASSSSVYGGNDKVPFHEDDRVDTPVSFYAATKRANELMAHTYAHLYGLPSTGLRFFTVYGPWGRPDMAYWTFTEAILAGRPIEVFGGGRLARDFTYCDDVAGAIVRLLERPPADAPPHRVLNVGNSDPHTVNELVSILERLTGRAALRVERPMPPGDVERTFADSGRLEALTGFRPVTPLEEGLARFVNWYIDFRAD